MIKIAFKLFLFIIALSAGLDEFSTLTTEQNLPGLHELFVQLMTQRSE